MNSDGPPHGPEVPPPQARRLGPYQLLGELGRGGFGVVWRARAPSGAEVALKVPHQGPTPELVARIRREAQLARRLTHPGLVRLLDLLELPDRPPVLVYEYLRGRPLEKLVPPGGMTLAEALPLLRDLAGALDALHDASLVHRDVKPENALVGEDGRLRLLDLGLLRPDRPGQTLTATGMLVGTPAFMAPEVLGGEPLSAASDRYSLACTAWCLLTGSPPFQGELGAVVRAHLKEPPPPLPASLEAAEPQIRRALEAGLAKRPGERPATCQELVEGLAPTISPQAPEPRPGATRRIGAGEGEGAPVTRELIPGGLGESSGSPPPRIPGAKNPGRVPGPAPAVPPRKRRGRPLRLLLPPLLLAAGLASFFLSPPHPVPIARPRTAPEPEEALDLVAREDALREEFSRLGDRFASGDGRLLRDEDLLANGDLPPGARSLQSPDPLLADLRREHTPRLQEILLRLLQSGEPPQLDPEQRRVLEDYDALRGRSRLPPLFAPLRIRPRDTPFPIQESLRTHVLEDTLLDALPSRASGWFGAALEAGTEALEEAQRLEDRYREAPEEFFPNKEGSSSQIFTMGFDTPLWSSIRNLDGIPAYRTGILARTSKGGASLRRCLFAGLRSLESEPETRAWACLLLRRILARTRCLHVHFLLGMPPDQLLLRPGTSPEAALVLAELLLNLDDFRLHWNLARGELRDALERSCRRALEGKSGPPLAELRRAVAWSHLQAAATTLPSTDRALEALREYWPRVRGSSPRSLVQGITDLLERLDRDQALEDLDATAADYLREATEILLVALDEVRPGVRKSARPLLLRCREVLGSRDHLLREPPSRIDPGALEEALRRELERQGDLWISPGGELLGPDQELTPGARPLLDPDPLFHELRRVHSPVLQEHLERLWTDLSAHPFPDSTREALAQQDERWASVALPRIFQPWTEAPPRREGEPVPLPPTLARVAGEEALLRDRTWSLEGWTRRALEEAERALIASQRLDAAFREDPRSLTGEDLPRPPLSMDTPLWVAVRNGGSSPAGRRSLTEALSPGGAHLRAALFAGLRGLEELPPERRPELAVLLRRVIRRTRCFLPSFLLPLPPEKLLLWPPGTPEGNALLGDLLVTVDLFRMHWGGGAREEYRRAILAAYSEALTLPLGTPAEREMVGDSWKILMETTSTWPDPEPCRRVFRRHWARLERASPRNRRDGLRAYLLRLERETLVRKLDRSERELVRSAVEDWVRDLGQAWEPEDLPDLALFERIQRALTRAP